MVPKRETLIEGRDGNELMNSTRAYKLHDEVTKSQCGKLNQKIINWNGKLDYVRLCQNLIVGLNAYEVVMKRNIMN